MQLVRTKSQTTSSFMEELFQRHRLTIFTHILQYVSSREDAEDILLEVFIAAFENAVIMTLNEHQQLAWLRRVASNKSIDYLRRAQRRTAVPIEQAAETLPEEDYLSPEQVTLRQEEISLLHTHLSSLPQLQQEIIQSGSTLSNERLYARFADYLT
ncbi:MAG TPA: RNA polymerase sigma factor [Dictyobacter sp.]|nr:RNA polymerase sigma factor [Dictyobacter sp.]